MKIAVVGKQRSGKDTLAKYFIDNDRAMKLAFGDAIKLVSRMYFPEIVAKGKPRFLYQFIGQKFREVDPKVWVKSLDKTLTFLESEGFESFVVTDVRQQNEYDYLKSKGFTVIKVEAEDELRRERIIKSGDQFNPEDFYHETEIAVDSIPCDYLLTNNTTIEDFYEQIKFVYEELEGERKL